MGSVVEKHPIITAMDSSDAITKGFGSLSIILTLHRDLLLFADGPSSRHDSLEFIRCDRDQTLVIAVSQLFE
jgi:hypothetical protein